MDPPLGPAPYTADQLRAMNPNLVPLRAVHDAVHVSIQAQPTLTAYYNTTCNLLERHVTKVANTQFAQVSTLQQCNSHVDTCTNRASWRSSSASATTSCTTQIATQTPRALLPRGTLPRTTLCRSRARCDVGAGSFSHLVTTASQHMSMQEPSLPTKPQEAQASL